MPQALPDLLDHLGVERLAGARAPRAACTRCWLRSSRMSMRHTVGGAHMVVISWVCEHLERAPRHEAGVVVDEDRGAGVEGGEEARPGVLGPARRADVHVDVPLADADPVHGGEVAHRVAALGVEHQLGLRGGPAREVEQDRVVDVGLAVRDEVRATRRRPRWKACQPGTCSPTTMRLKSPARPRIFSAPSGSVMTCLDLPARHAVLDVLRRQQRRGRDDHRPELHGGQHHLPDVRPSWAAS